MATSTVAERLLRLRELHGLSQEDAAHRVGIGLRAFQRWESGNTQPHKRNLQALAAAFDVSVAEFFGDVGVDQAQLDRIEAKLDELLALMRKPARVGSHLPPAPAKNGVERGAASSPPAESTLPSGSRRKGRGGSPGR